MTEHVLVSGTADNWFYLRFANEGLAQTYIGLCEEAGLGTAYLNSGWAKAVMSDCIVKNTTLITDEMLDELETSCREEADEDEEDEDIDDEFAGELSDEASDLITDFECEHGFDDEEEENGEPY